MWIGTHPHVKEGTVLPKAMLMEHSLFTDNSKTSAFVSDQIKHVFLAIPRPKRSALSSVPQRSFRTLRNQHMTEIDDEYNDEDFLFDASRDPQTHRYFLVRAKIKHILAVWNNMSSLLKVTFITR